MIKYAVMAINERTREQQTRHQTPDLADARAQCAAVREVLSHDSDPWTVHIVKMTGDVGAGEIIDC